MRFLAPHRYIVLAILALTALLSSCSRDERPNLILISIDTLRADHLGSYGYERETSPNLDRLATDAVVFERAISSSSWTLPSHVSLFTSNHPSTHHAVVDELKLDPDTPVLPTLLRDAGFATAGFVDHIYVGRPYGFERGFDLFDDTGGGAASILPRALDWLDRRDSKPFFLFLHLFDVHCPYTPPGDYAERFRTPDATPFDLSGKCGNPDLNEMSPSSGQIAHIIDQYDGEIAALDARLGSFFEVLKDRGLWENTVVMVTSDHGEEFGEHGKIGHEGTLYHETLWIPFIVRAPSVGPRRVEELVGGVDLAPTALELLGVDAPEGFQGRSLVPAILGDAFAGLPVFSELDRQVVRRSLRKDRHHVIWSKQGERVELYDVEDDPRETSDSCLSEQARCSALFEEMIGIATRATAAGRLRKQVPMELTPELEERLRSLGYVQ